MFYTTTEIAAACRTTGRGIRLWERKGLLGPVRRNSEGHRLFTDAHIRRGKEISAASMAGMTLSEIAKASDQSLWDAINAGADFMAEARSSIFAEDFDL